jgi:hypothetical protein
MLCKARDKMKEIAQFVNDQKKKVDNYLKVCGIIEGISGMEEKVLIIGLFVLTIFRQSFCLQLEDL